MSAPVERERWRVRLSYDIPDDRFDHLHASDTEAWRVAVGLDRLAALLEPLAGLEVCEYEHRLLEWLAGMDAHPVMAGPAGPRPRGRAARVTSTVALIIAVGAVALARCSATSRAALRAAGRRSS
ncbi:hypothetical protein [Pseudonocardia sp.]|uniref:hypothetical protein n=1 Tax=Pseudonocardia sp. TaxID=60912 RepID=UPI0031FBAA39